ncbi:hypothetical protein [Actinomadura roseirufa]|uniref:hypothetical protein n=1 Tax=Actinomadura roseirufa TaxID=2094049 RepID=UPI0010414098|nr:hypothetical protein [Actinomadura roseirufa]
MTTTGIRTRFGRLDVLALWGAAAGCAAAAALLAAVLTDLRPSLPAISAGYTSWHLGYGDPDWYLYWIVGDATEATMAKSALGAVLMVAGAALAHALRRRDGGPRGFAQACGTNLWPWVLASAVLGTLASNLMWGWTLRSTGAWQPTFAPFVSVPPAVVVLYGAGWPVALTGAVLGASLVTPIALALVNWVCVPLDVSPVVGSVLAMSIGGLIAFAICRGLPWLRPERLRPAEPVEPGPDRTGTASWIPRRILADFTEAHFYGSEWAGAGLLIGCVLQFLLNPAGPAYGSGLLPQMIAAQVLTAACGVLLWRTRWSAAGWYPTFVPVVSVAPATALAFGGALVPSAAGALLGAAAGPPLAAALARRVPAHVHPMVAYTAAMGVCTATIIPLVDLLPGCRLS